MSSYRVTACLFAVLVSACAPADGLPEESEEQGATLVPPLPGSPEQPTMPGPLLLDDEELCNAGGLDAPCLLAFAWLWPLLEPVVTTVFVVWGLDLYVSSQEERRPQRLTGTLQDALRAHCRKQPDSTVLVVDAEGNTTEHRCASLPAK